MGEVYPDVLKTKITNKVELHTEYYQILEELKKLTLI